MINLSWRLIKHTDLTVREKLKIAELKDQHWKYGIDSQIKWIMENILDNDYHVLGEENTKSGYVLRAYFNMVNIKIKLDKDEIEAIGIGNVCVDKNVEHSGYGKLLVLKANEYINLSEKQGALLCRKSLVDFYRKFGWKTAAAENAFVEENPYSRIIMLFPLKEDMMFSNIVISRSF